MPEVPDYCERKPGWYAQRKTLYGGLIFLVATICLSVLGFVKPVVTMARGQPGIHLKNEGRLGARIHRVDGFWYWGGQVAMLRNIPPIQQTVQKGTLPVRLQIPDIPSPDGYGIQQEACYMKLIIRYTIPGIPIFRFTAPLYFRFDEKQHEWISTDSIPPQHRALGNLAVGNVDRVDLNFH
jgi:hypothetical protein